MKSVQEWCDPDNWTGEILMKEGALPDLEAWEATFRKSVGESLKLRGVEVAVVGTLVEVDGKPAFRLEGGRTLPIAPLDRKVQWDPKKKAERLASPEESDAHQRLVDRLASKAKTKAKTKTKAGGPVKLKVTGPLKAPAAKGDEPTLTVREFAEIEP